MNDLLDLSQIEANQIFLQISEFNLNKLTAEVIKIYTQQAQDRSISISMEPLDNGGIVSGDPRRIKQVISNLLSNALKYTPKNGNVGIKLQEFSSNFQITVWDTGIGIEAKYIDYLFEPFFRIVEPGTNQPQGTGLGLPLSKKIVDAHGGKIAIQSIPQKGTKITVSLPKVPIARMFGGGDKKKS